jgi:sulfite reductase (NADPH) hemoprotein beta-component
MYRYDHFDQRVIDERVAQFRDQTRAYLAGELSDDDFRPLRLQNGLYIQKACAHATDFDPVWALSTRQLRTLAHIGRAYDRGYGHFTTRQNIQFNWPHVEQVPDILADLARVEMHAIQTSGNCIRNISADHFAGVAGDETVDARPYSELVRQWATAASGIRLSPAQVQDRAERCHTRSRGDPRARHRAPARRRRSRRGRLSSCRSAAASDVRR